MRFAIATGSFSGTSLDSDGEQFYRLLVKMSLEINNNKFTMKDNYKNAESSMKNTISFHLGMIMAKVIAEKRYGIGNLLHLKDRKLEVKTTRYKADYFGRVKKDSTRAFLIEAKGQNL